MVRLRVLLVSQYASAVRGLITACRAVGAAPVAVVAPRSDRPGEETDGAGKRLEALVATVPPALDVIAVATAEQMPGLVEAYRADLLLCRGFPWLLPPVVLQAPSLGGLNVHPSLLPRYRGPLPVQWAVRNGDERVGLTVHRMDERFDTGPIVTQGSVPVEPEDEAPDLWRKLNAVAERLVADALVAVANRLQPTPQNEADASWAGFMECAFATIDFSQSVATVHNQVRAWRFGGIDGGPGPVAELDGRRVRVVRTRLEPGEGARVECADGPIWIVESAPV